MRVIGDEVDVVMGRRVVGRLVSADGSEVWHWDGPLASVDGRLSYRAGIRIPAGTAPGSYELQLVVYAAESAGDGRRRVTQISDPVGVGEVRIRPP
jgi:hypothetical protein